MDCEWYSAPCTPPPYGARTTRGTPTSPCISSHNVSWMVWTTFFSVMGSVLAVRVQVQQRRLRFGVRRLPGPGHRVIDFRLQLGAGLLGAVVVEEPELLQRRPELHDRV